MHRLKRQNVLILLLATENPWKSITVRNLEIYQVFHDVLGHNSIASFFLVLNNLFHGFTKKMFYKRQINE